MQFSCLQSNSASIKSVQVRKKSCKDKRQYYNATAEEEGEFDEDEA